LVVSSFGTELGVIAIEGLVGLVILALLWPSPKAARRLLIRWGAPHPTEAEVAQALTYLRRRRFWYPWLCIGLPALLDGTRLLPDNQDGNWEIPAMLLIGALLAEMFAQRRAPAPVRAAVPVRRGVTDLVPGWALALHGLAALAAFVLLGGALAGIGWARNWYPSWSTRTLWVALGAAVLTVLVVWVVVGLALRRPPVAELRIDPLLRMRSARVPVGLGTATLCALAAGGQSDLRGALIVVVGLFLWVRITARVRTPVPA
jgi:hypothetical protein